MSITINLGMPIDSTLLSNLFYEGVLFLVSKTNSKIINTRQVIIKTLTNNELNTLYKDSTNTCLNQFTIVGNDHTSLKKTLKKEIRAYSSFDEILKILTTVRNLFKADTFVNLSITGNTLIDLEDSKDGVAIQILKADRYTGLSSFEEETFADKLTLKASTRAVFIAILGLASSCVIQVRENKSRYTYLCFFSPDEILNALSLGDKEWVEKLFNIKKKAQKIIGEALTKTSVNEVILLETMLNTSLVSEMKKYSVDKLSLMLFKIAIEGQTYKVYEAVPITLFSDVVFYSRLSRYVRKTDGFLNILREYCFDKNSVVMKALNSLRFPNPRPEANNVLSALLGLYRFVVLGDASGFSTFMRELWNAHEKTKNKEGRSPYSYILGNLRRGLA